MIFHLYKFNVYKLNKKHSIDTSRLAQLCGELLSAWNFFGAYCVFCV